MLAIVRRAIGAPSVLITVFASSLAVGCAPSPPPKAPIQTVAGTQGDIEPEDVKPSLAAEDVPDDAPTFQSQSDDLLVGFVERRVGREHLDDANRSELRARAAPGTTTFTKLWLSHGHNVVFVLHTPTDVRATVIARTTDGGLVPSVAWVGLALKIDGAAPVDIASWYRELARRVATTGSATGIVLFTKGNATGVRLSIETTPGDEADVQLVARVRFLKDGTFNADAWGPKIQGVERLHTTVMNQHAGVSIKDLLRRGQVPAAAPPLAPVTAPAPMSTADVIPPNPTNLDRICGTYCRRLAECQQGAGAPQCEENCLLRNPNKLRPYYRQDYVDASVGCFETAACDIILRDSNKCSIDIRPPPTDAVTRYCAQVGKQIFDCSGRTDGETACLKTWGLIRDDVADELSRRCGGASCDTRVHCHDAAVGLPGK